MEDFDLGWELKKTVDSTRLYVNNLIKKCLEDNGISISWTEAMVLTYVFKHPDMIVSAKLLLSKFKLSKATMSQTLASLVRKGLIEYEEWEGDGRVKRIVLTKKSDEAWQVLSKVMADANSFFKSAFTDEEVQTFISLLQKLYSHLGIEEEN